MKIGIDGRLWNETGVGRYIRNLVYGIDSLEEKNPKHTYYIFLCNQEYKDLIFNSPNLIKKKANVRWHSLREQFFLPEILEKENLDLVHFPYFSVPITYTRPFMITLHDLIISDFATGKASTLPAPLYWAKKVAYDKVINTAIHKSKKIIVPSEFVKKEVLKKFAIPEEKIMVTYEGVDGEITKENKEEEVESLHGIPFFLYVGNAYPHKNVEFLIEAFSQFLEKHPEYKNMHLALVGKEDYFYKRIKKQFQGKTSVVFLHNISDEKLTWLYKNAVSLVMPSLSEGFGLTNIEAMASSCLVLASSIPVFKEICGKWAVYFNPRDQKDLMDKMKIALTMDENEKKIYISEAKKFVKKYSWEEMVKETVKVYESSLSV